MEILSGSLTRNMEDILLLILNIVSDLLLLVISRPMQL